MAELADAHGSGPCESSLIQVQVLLSALKNSLEINVPGLFSFSAAFPSQSRSPEKNRGSGLARIRIWGGRQGRSYHKCEPCNIAGTVNRGNKTAPVIDFYGRDGIVLTYQVISALEDFFETITVVASRLIYKTKYGTLEAEAGSEPFLCFTVIHKGRTTQN